MQTTPVEKVVGHLDHILFYYILRVGVYSLQFLSNRDVSNKTRTIQFTVKDITLWKRGIILTKWRTFHQADKLRFGYLRNKTVDETVRFATKLFAIKQGITLSKLLHIELSIFIYMVDLKHYGCGITGIIYNGVNLFPTIWRQKWTQNHMSTVSARMILVRTLWERMERWL